MYNIAICDDEKIILDSLSKQINEVSKNRLNNNRLNNIFTFNTIDELTSHMLCNDSSLDISILFLDIEIGESSGIDAATSLLALRPNLQIIFISGHDDYYLDVYDVEHLYFLKKPIAQDALSKALLRAEERLLAYDRETFQIKSRYSSTTLMLDDILFFEKDLRQILAHTINETYSFYGKFADIMPQLNDKFCRCHNSFVVNISKVKRMNSNAFVMVDDNKIPISRSRSADTKTAYLTYLEGVLK